MPQWRMWDCYLPWIGWCKWRWILYLRMFRLLFLFNFRDRIRTTNNMLGDCYASAVIQAISKDELKESEIPEILSLTTVLVADR